MTTETTEKTRREVSDDDMTAWEGTPFGAALKAGTYPAVVMGLQPVWGTDYETKEDLLQTRWTFGLDVDGALEEVDAWTSMSTGTKSKNRAWVKSITGSEPPEGATFKTVAAALIGASCLVVIEISEKGYPKVASVMPPLSRR